MRLDGDAALTAGQLDRVERACRTAALQPTLAVRGGAGTVHGLLSLVDSPLEHGAGVLPAALLGNPCGSYFYSDIALIDAD